MLSRSSFRRASSRYTLIRSRHWRAMVSSSSVVPSVWPEISSSITRLRSGLSSSSYTREAGLRPCERPTYNLFNKGSSKSCYAAISPDTLPVARMEMTVSWARRVSLPFGSCRGLGTAAGRSYP